MSDDWHRFLVQAGAEIRADVVRSFGDPQAELRAALAGGVVCDLGHRGLIRVEGQEAVRFLQGQLTCDVATLSGTRSLLGAWCSPKGRVLALFRIVADGEGMLLELPAARLEAVLKRLKMYVLRARVTLADASSRFVRLGLSGDVATEVLQAALESAPERPDAVVGGDTFRLIRLHGAAPRYQFLGDLATGKRLWRAAAARLTPAGAEAWELLEILAGVPEVIDEDEHLPQMINLDTLGGVSFDKGCFVGQEVIARAQNLGRVKRRLYPVRTQASGAVRGASIVDAAGSGETAGVLLRAAAHPEGGVAGLAVLRIEAAERGDLRLGSGDGPAVTLPGGPLPVSAPAG